MPDAPLISRSAFGDHFAPASRFAAPGTAGVAVMVRDLSLALISARKGQQRRLAATVRDLFGIELPLRPKREAAGPVAFIGVAPGQWLAVGPPGAPAAFADRLAGGLAGLASLCDQSDARAVLRVTGARARDALGKGVPIDLHPRVFGPGDAAVTIVEQIGLQLWQIDDEPTYEVAVARSLAGSFAHWLKTSAAEYGLVVTP